MSAVTVRRALIVKFGAIGDVAMALPAVRRLHETGFEVDWVCGAAVLPLLAGFPWIRTIVADDRAILKGSTLARVRALAQLWGGIGRTEYDLCATLYYDARYRLVALPVRARRKIMLSREGRERRLIAARHYSDEYARILLAEEDTCRAGSLAPLRPEKFPASPLRGKAATLRIALVPGGASNMLREQTLRRWPVERYAELARELLARGSEVILIGGPDDVWVRPHFAGMDVTDAIGSLSLPEVIAVSDTCDLVVSHDTGPMHLAGMSGAGLVALFGPTDPGNFLPRRAGVRGIWGGEGFACRPCYDGRDFAPCRDNGCMQQITVGMVLTQIDALLAERAAGSVAPGRIVLPSSMEASAR